jgi:outer membrane murein-binding lipoprotein Lpp
MTVSGTNGGINLSPNGTGVVTVLSTSGGVYAPAYYYNSDRRLKENIQDIKGLESILALRGVSFQWKHNGQPEIGLIAQEVEKVLPELVHENPETGIKSVKYGNLVAPLIQSTKELYGMCEDNRKQLRTISSEVVDLKSKVQTLEEENKQLKADIQEIKSLLKMKRH